MSDDLVKRLRDLASLEVEAMPPGWKDAYWLYRAAADRIEADAERIRELERLLENARDPACAPDIAIEVALMRAEAAQ